MEVREKPGTNAIIIQAWMHACVSGTQQIKKEVSDSKNEQIEQHGK